MLPNKLKNLINILIHRKPKLYQNFRETMDCPKSSSLDDDKQKQIAYLSQQQAISLDELLFSEYGYNIEQLMELAGLSVATAIYKTYPNKTYDKPLIFCGPGNNGGDGLVCGRHLKLFGYHPIIVYPKQGKGRLFENLVLQCKKFDIDIITDESYQTTANKTNLMVDAVFGFSFKPPNRAEVYAKMLNYMAQTNIKESTPLVSIDVPSGWHVEEGYKDLDTVQIGVENQFKIAILKPECLISLTAPKKCALHFTGKHHWLGGRFCPPTIQNKYNIPNYPQADCVVKLS